MWPFLVLSHSHLEFGRFDSIHYLVSCTVSCFTFQLPGVWAFWQQPLPCVLYSFLFYLSATWSLGVLTAAITLCPVQSSISRCGTSNHVQVCTSINLETIPPALTFHYKITVVSFVLSISNWFCIDYREQKMYTGLYSSLTKWNWVGSVMGRLQVCLRLYKIPTREKKWSFKRHETCPVYTRRCIESIPPESIFEYCTSKVGYPSDLSKYNIWFHLRS